MAALRGFFLGRSPAACGGVLHGLGHLLFSCLVRGEKGVFTAGWVGRCEVAIQLFPRQSCRREVAMLWWLLAVADRV